MPSPSSQISSSLQAAGWKLSESGAREWSHFEVVATKRYPIPTLHAVRINVLAASDATQAIRREWAYKSLLESINKEAACSTRS